MDIGQTLPLCLAGSHGSMNTSERPANLITTMCHSICYAKRFTQYIGNLAVVMTHCQKKRIKIIVILPSESDSLQRKFLQRNFLWLRWSASCKQNFVSFSNVKIWWSMSVVVLFIYIWLYDMQLDLLPTPRWVL